MLELTNISKRYGGTTALASVALTLRGGEIHVVLGQNGAGKSTLIKVLSGACQPDGGSITVDGNPVVFASPQDGHRAGIAVIYQEFSLIPSLNIARNIFLGREREFSRFGFLLPRRMHAEARIILDRLGLDYDTRLLVRDLTVAQQQMVEIAKALSRDAKVLILDEPTSAISDREADVLMAMVERLRDEGRAILYVSHRMNEVVRLGDRVTVLRDGRCIHTEARGASSTDALIEKMIGRLPEILERREIAPRHDAALETAGLSAPGIVNASIHVQKGEIVGLAGLIGSGRTELLRAIFGLERIRSGQVRLFGERYRPSPTRARARAMGFIPEDRKQQGLALSLSVRENLLACSLGSLGWVGIVWPRRAEGKAHSLARELSIKAASLQANAGTLSGGNQQKIVFAKWLATSSKLLLLDEPTRGIDIGAKAEIYRLIRRLAESGTGILVVSSDLPELIQICDRAYVLRAGQVVAELAGAELTEKRILQLAVHHDPEHHAL